MSYQFREVKCPRCDHVFMWNKDGICECLGLAFINQRLRFAVRGKYA